MGFRWEIIQEYAPLFMEGAWMTIKCTLICVILGTCWGLTLGLGRLAQAPHGPWKWILHYGVQWPVRIYVSALRGTPLFVQIMVVHFALIPLLINPRDGLFVSGGLMSADFARMLRADYGAFLSCIVAITLNAGAYVSEIFRAGIQSIDRGQMEASSSLGMSYGRTCAKSFFLRHFVACCRRSATMLSPSSKIHHSLLRLGWPISPTRHVRCQVPMPPLGTLFDHFSGLLGHHFPALGSGAADGNKVKQK